MSSVGSQDLQGDKGGQSLRTREEEVKGGLEERERDMEELEQEWHSGMRVPFS